MKTRRTEPELDRPGAGLPAIERFIAKRMISASYRKADRNSIAADFKKEQNLIESLASGVDVELGSEPFLIKRRRGMEDSSRYWSVYMVLDHLRIVNDAVAEFVEMLAKGEVPQVQADTAKVKPDPEVGPEMIEAFRNSCADFISTVASIENLKTGISHPHPWFGPMDASQWHHMASFHMTLHRRQIEDIIAGLGRASTA